MNINKLSTNLCLKKLFTTYFIVNKEQLKSKTSQGGGGDYHHDPLIKPITSALP